MSSKGPKVLQSLVHSLAAVAVFQNTGCVAETWIDNENGNVISLDGDQGWAIYECEDTYKDCSLKMSVEAYCNVTSDCIREDYSGKVYYGPFNNDESDAKWMTRRFSCEYVQNNQHFNCEYFFTVSLRHDIFFVPRLFFIYSIILRHRHLPGSIPMLPSHSKYLRAMPMELRTEMT